MATVRDTDLPDLLISLGYQVKRIGRYYTTQEMDSIRIKDRRTWFRYSEGIGGDAITFLQRFYNKSFPEAVEYLLTWHGRARDSPPVSTPRQTKEKEEKVPFTPAKEQAPMRDSVIREEKTPKKESRSEFDLAGISGSSSISKSETSTETTHERPSVLAQLKGYREQLDRQHKAAPARSKQKGRPKQR